MYSKSLQRYVTQKVLYLILLWKRECVLWCWSRKLKNNYSNWNWPIAVWVPNHAEWFFGQNKKAITELDENLPYLDWRAEYILVVYSYNNNTESDSERTPAFLLSASHASFFLAVRNHENIKHKEKKGSWKIAAQLAFLVQSPHVVCVCVVGYNNVMVLKCLYIRFLGQRMRDCCGHGHYYF